MSKKIFISFLIIFILGGIVAYLILFKPTEDIGNELEKKEATEISEEFMIVKIFLSDSRFVGEPYFDCSRTVVVERQVPKTLAIAKATIESLLRGATQEEINQGFVSNINSGVRIQSLTIENKVAKIDFDEQMEFQVGGSCWVAAIRAQITETLKQFSTIDNVVISINGRTEDILQP